MLNILTEGYYIWLGWSNAREDFIELDKYYATEEEEAEFEQMMLKMMQKQLDEESEPDYSLKLIGITKHKITTNYFPTWACLEKAHLINNTRGTK
jgi:hypothetical protein